MDKFRAVWEKVDAALFQILRHICAVILGALVAVVFYSSSGVMCCTTLPCGASRSPCCAWCG